MAIRVAHGMTGALSGAAGFYTRRDQDRDRRGAAAGRLFNASLDRKQRKIEFEHKRAMDVARLAMQAGEQLNNNLRYQDARRDKRLKKTDDQRKQNEQNAQAMRDARLGEMRGNSERAEQQRANDYADLRNTPRSSAREERLVQKQIAPQAIREVSPEPQSGGMSQLEMAAFRSANARQAPVVPDDARQAPVAPNAVSYSQSIDDRGTEMQRNLSSMDLTPDGNRMRGRMLGELQAVREQRNILRPDAYAQGMQQVLDRYDSSGIDSYVKQPKTLQGATDARFQDLGTGYGMVLQPDDKIQVLKVDDRKAEQASSGSPTSDVASPRPQSAMDFATEAARSYRGSGDAPSEVPAFAPEPQYLHENQIPEKGYTPYMEESFDSQSNANMRAAQLKAEGWNVEIVPGPKSSTRTKNPDGSGSVSESQDFNIVASKDRVLSPNEQISQATQSIGDFMSDDSRRSETIERIMKSRESSAMDAVAALGPDATPQQRDAAALSAYGKPTEQEITQQMALDYQGYKQGMDSMRQDAGWRQANFDEAQLAMQREVSPARKSFYDANWRQTEMALYGESGKYPSPNDVREALDYKWKSSTTTPENLRRMEFLHDSDIRGRVAADLGRYVGDPMVTDALSNAWRAGNNIDDRGAAEAVRDPYKRMDMIRRLAAEAGAYPSNSVLRSALAEEAQKIASPASRPGSATAGQSSRSDSQKSGMRRGEDGRIYGATEQDLRNALKDLPNKIPESDIQAMLGPKALNEFKKLGSKNPRQDALNYYTDLFTPAVKKPLPGVMANEVQDPMDRSKLSIRPRPNTRKEYDELPPGTLYIAPNGETRRKK